MYLKLRRRAQRDIDNCRICNDDGRNAGLLQVAEVFLNALDILVVRINIRGDKYFGAVFLGELHAFPHFLEAEIVRVRTQAVFLPADIYRIRAIMHGEFQFFQIARRSQELRFVQAVSFAFVLRLGHSAHTLSPLLYFRKRCRFPYDN
ncbi:hypothetical protein D3C71_1559170 [compost metagenome]